MTRIFLYPQLGTTSKRALLRIRGNFGRPYTYRPRGNLLQRLARDNGLSIEATYRQLFEERRQLLRELGLEELL